MFRTFYMHLSACIIAFQGICQHLLILRLFRLFSLLCIIFCVCLDIILNVKTLNVLNGIDRFEGFHVPQMYTKEKGQKSCINVLYTVQYMDKGGCSLK